MLVAAGATLVRLLSSFIQGGAVADLPGINDQISYDALARRLLGGYGYSFASGWWPMVKAGDPTAFWSYLYTALLAMVYALTDGSVLAARLLQAVAAGILHPWLTWRIGNRLFGPRAGIAAAAIAALYPYFVYYAGALVTETLTILAILWVFDLATGAVRTKGLARIGGQQIWQWALLGLAIGVSALMRQVTLIVLPLTFGWLFLMSRGHRRSCIVGMLVSSAIVAALILPWTARNYVVFGRPTLLNTNAGYAFFWGNHPIYGTTFTPILTETTYASLIPADLRGLNEAEMDAALLRRGMQFVINDPGRYALLSLSRAVEYFKFWASPDSGLVSNVARVFSFGLALPFMLYGLVISLRPSVPVPGQRPAVWLLIAFCAVYALVHLLSWALVRYRLPVDAVLVIFAGLGVSDLAERIWRYRERTRAS